MLVVGYLVLGQIPAATLTFWTWLIATLSLLPFALPSLKDNLDVVRKEIIPLFFFALLGVSGFQYLIFSGLIRASAISAAVLSPTIPIMVACIGWPLLREKLSAIQVLGVIISFIGACWIATSGNLSNLVDIKPGFGESLILTANLCMAGYTIMLRLCPSQLTPVAFMGVIALLGTVQVLPLSILEMGWSVGINQIGSLILPLLYIGVVNYSLAYVFWNIAVKRHGATVTALFLYLIPIIGAVLSLIFLQEILYSYHIIGVILIFVGLVLALHLNAPDIRPVKD